VRTVNGLSRLTKLTTSNGQPRPIRLENFRIGQSLSNKIESDGRFEFESNLEASQALIQRWPSVMVNTSSRIQWFEWKSAWFTYQSKSKSHDRPLGDWVEVDHIQAVPSGDCWWKAPFVRARWVGRNCWFIFAPCRPIAPTLKSSVREWRERSHFATPFSVCRVPEMFAIDSRNCLRSRWNFDVFVVPYSTW